MTTPTTDAGRAREYAVANLFDGDDGGFLTATTATFATEVADVMDEYAQEAVTRVLDALAGEVVAMACACVTHEDCTRDCHTDRGNLSGSVGTAAVLALIEQHRPKGGPG